MSQATRNRLSTATQAKDFEMFNSAGSNPNHSTSGKFLQNALWIAIILCVVSTILNIISLPLARKPVKMRHEDLVHLERPNQYIGLDAVQRPSPPTFRQIIKYPIVMAQINRSAPDQVFTDDPKRWLSQSGTLSPEDRRLLITPQVSTIVQFRAIDFGMEDCELSIVVQSSPDENSNYDSQLKLGPYENIIDVSILESKSAYNTKTLSWANRPKPVEKLVSIDMQRGTNFTYRFHCPSDTTHAFELSAALSDDMQCHVEWWQDKIQPPSAIFMKQRATV